MTFQEYFQQVKARFLGADISAVSDPTRIQINLTGQAAGTFPVAAFTFGKLKAQGDLGKALELKKLLK